MNGGSWVMAVPCGTMAYDPQLNLLYIGVGNGAPWNRQIRSPMVATTFPCRRSSRSIPTMAVMCGITRPRRAKPGITPLPST